MRSGYEPMRANGSTARAGYWSVSPAAPKAASTFQLRFNRKAPESPLAKVNIPESGGLTLRYGFNNWQSPVVVQMTRAPPEAPAVRGRRGRVEGRGEKVKVRGV